MLGHVPMEITSIPILKTFDHSFRLNPTLAAWPAQALCDPVSTPFKFHLLPLSLHSRHRPSCCPFCKHAKFTPPSSTVLPPFPRTSTQLISSLHLGSLVSRKSPCFPGGLPKQPICTLQPANPYPHSALFPFSALTLPGTFPHDKCLIYCQGHPLAWKVHVGNNSAYDSVRFQHLINDTE